MGDPEDTGQQPPSGQEPEEAETEAEATAGTAQQSSGEAGTVASDEGPPDSVYHG